jgi:hypothetical protein
VRPGDRIEATVAPFVIPEAGVYRLELAGNRFWLVYVGVEHPWIERLRHAIPRGRLPKIICADPLPRFRGEVVDVAPTAFTLRRDWHEE